MSSIKKKKKKMAPTGYSKAEVKRKPASRPLDAAKWDTCRSVFWKHVSLVHSLRAKWGQVSPRAWLFKSGSQPARASCVSRLASQEQVLKAGVPGVSFPNLSLLREKPRVSSLLLIVPHASGDGLLALGIVFSLSWALCCGLSVVCLMWRGRSDSA